MRRLLWALLALGCSASPPVPTPTPTPKGPPTYVGSARCEQCHQGQGHAWQESQHARAMQEPTASTVLGDFNTTFTHEGVTTRFSQAGGVYTVHTEGHDYPVRYVFGLYPLQQYLLDVGKGRLQAFSVAWDCRRKRWFHLYAGQGLQPGDPLHWTGRGQNWNHMCADCHSTDVHKNYHDGRYDTRFAEISVGCEACHGPGSRHADEASEPLPIDLTPPADHHFTKGALKPVDTAYTRKETEMCARCHSRRHQFRDGWAAGDPLLDAYLPSTLDDDLYFVDGQQKDEVFTYGSFVQSKMYRSGVACTDCHDAHTMKLRLPGDQLCLSCHTPEPGHSHHQQVSCVDCHAPTRTYMGVDPRHDHSFRIPRPDLSQQLGTPNACTQCHKDKPASWAAAALSRWFPHPPAPHFATTLAAARQGAPGAADELRKLASDPNQSLSLRATAVALVGDPAAARDPEPWLRQVAARGGAPGLTADPVRGVRMEAALAESRGLEEYLEAQARNGDLPESHLNVALAQPDKAEAEYREALKLDPSFVAGYVNLADFLRATGRDSEAPAVLREGLQRVRPQERFDLYYALGLWQARAHQLKPALASLEQAYRLAPHQARLAVGYALALDSNGQPRKAVQVLQRALREHPYDRDLLACLVDLTERLGQPAATLRARLQQLDPPR